jgi:hypothetical protein
VVYLFIFILFRLSREATPKSSTSFGEIKGDLTLREIFFDILTTKKDLLTPKIDHPPACYLEMNYIISVMFRNIPYIIYFILG